jgi:hypothetical protein
VRRGLSKCACGARVSVRAQLIDESGAAVQANVRNGPAVVSASAPPRAVAGIRLAGKYSDAAHPGCFRKLTTIGTNKVLVEGADEDGKKWTVRGTSEGKVVTLDFTPKGGPKDITATYSIAKGLTFADGNVWTKL